MLLGLLFVGLIGTSVELLLLEHTEDVWQRVPLFMMALGAIVLVWQLLRPSVASVRILKSP